jgi:hypothetical protein
MFRKACWPFMSSLKVCDLHSAICFFYITPHTHTPTTHTHTYKHQPHPYTQTPTQTHTHTNTHPHPHPHTQTHTQTHTIHQYHFSEAAQHSLTTHNIRPYNYAQHQTLSLRTFHSTLRTVCIYSDVAKHVSNQLTSQILKISIYSPADGCYFVIILGKYGI